MTDRLQAIAALIARRKAEGASAEAIIRELVTYHLPPAAFGVTEADLPY